MKHTCVNEWCARYAYRFCFFANHRVEQVLPINTKEVGVSRCCSETRERKAEGEELWVEVVVQLEAGVDTHYDTDAQKHTHTDTKEIVFKGYQRYELREETEKRRKKGGTGTRTA